MVIVWRGFGLLGIFVPAVCASAIYSAVRSVTSSDYMGHHHWPMAVGLGISAGLLFLIAQLRDREHPGRDALYYIPLRYWSFIFGIVALGFLLVPSTPVAEARPAGPQT